MDDFSVRKVLNAVAGVVPRDYVVMEVRANLLKDERKKTLKRFSAPCFKKTARVVMGEPTQEFKDVQLARLLDEKQQRDDTIWKAQRLEKARKKQVEERQKQFEEEQKKKSVEQK